MSSEEMGILGGIVSRTNSSASSQFNLLFANSFGLAIESQKS